MIVKLYLRERSVFNPLGGEGKKNAAGGGGTRAYNGVARGERERKSAPSPAKDAFYRSRCLL